MITMAGTITFVELLETIVKQKFVFRILNYFCLVGGRDNFTKLRKMAFVIRSAKVEMDDKWINKSNQVLRTGLFIR